MITEEQYQTALKIVEATMLFKLHTIVHTVITVISVAIVNVNLGTKL